MPWSGIEGKYGNSIFSFLRDPHTVLHSGYTNYIPTNSVGGFPFLHSLSSIQYVNSYVTRSMLKKMLTTTD